MPSLLRELGVICATIVPTAFAAIPTAKPFTNLLNSNNPIFKLTKYNNVVSTNAIKPIINIFFEPTLLMILPVNNLPPTVPII